MTKKISKQFFITHCAGNDDIDFGIIHMSEDELNNLIEEKMCADGDICEYINKELGITNFESWIRLECSEDNVDKLLFLTSAITNELNRIKSSNYLDIIKYSIDIIVQAKELDEDSRRDLVEEVGKIAKNIKRDEDERNEGEETE